MTSLYKFLLDCVQYYSIFLGLNYMYIDINKRQIIFNKNVKIYVYFINILYGALLIYRLITSVISYLKEGITVSWNSYIELIFYTIRIYIFVSLIFSRSREEKALKMYLKILQSNYFDSFEMLIKLLVMILIIFCNGFYVVYIAYPSIAERKFWTLFEHIAKYIETTMRHFILFHHSFILCYINHGIIKLNNQLQTLEVQESLADVYIKLTLILQQINRIFTPTILGVMLYLIFEITLSLFETIVVFIEDAIHLQYILEYSAEYIFLSDIILYFVICDRIYKTGKETEQILRAYNLKQNNKEV